MRLNQKNLGPLLATILGVEEKYVVPRQGNVWNPQLVDSDTGRPVTWCAYRIDGERPVTVSHFVADAESTPRNWSVQHKTATVTLQFIGDIAEDLANDVGHWTHREAVRAALAQFDAQLYGDSGEVIVSDFDQQGANTVLAYNVRFRMVWADEIDTEQDHIIGMVMVGEVT